MPVNEGGFVWYEYMADDISAAQAFYTKVIGWRAEDAGMPGISYTLLKVGERAVAGMMATPENGAAHWIGYILTADVDATAERLQQAGGSVHRPPADIPGIGRFAVVSDPQGASFVLFRGDGTPPPDLAPATQGTIGWHELHARNWEPEFAFYQSLFGWKKSQTVDMGPMGIYQTFDAGDASPGGMMTSKHPAMPFWLYYFNVDNIESAVARLSEEGGKVLQGPHQVPGGSWIVQANDPQGGMFAVVGPRSESVVQ